MKAKRQVISESQLAARVVAWLEERSFDVYQEVRLQGVYDSCADIVAVKDQQVWVIESKLRYSLEVISQARAWMQTATYVSIAVPAAGRQARQGRNLHSLAREVCDWKGIGIVEVDIEADHVVQRLFPRATGIAYASPFLDAVRPEHKTHARAGTNRGGMWTPFRGSAEKLESFVAEHPGVSLKEATRMVENHYSSRWAFMAAVRKLAGKVIRGIEVREVHGVDCLFPVEQEVA